MGTQLQPVNNKKLSKKLPENKEPEKVLFIPDGYYANGIYFGVTKSDPDEEDLLFCAEGQGTGRCAMAELIDFEFASKLPKEVKQLEFNKFFERYVREQSEASMVCLNLTRNHKATTSCHQPQFLIDALEAYPGAYCLPWYLNESSGNEVQYWFLPTPGK